MKEIVINRQYGGFELSHEAVMLYAKYKGIKLYFERDDRFKSIEMVHYSTIPKEELNKMVEKDREIGNYKKSNSYCFSPREILRDDNDLIKVVKKLGKKANTRFSNLQIVQIPDNVEWEISEYDGMESVEEKHRSWS